MPENTRLSLSIGQIDLGFVERETTSQLLIMLSIQLHLTGLSLLNTVRVSEIFSVERAQSTVHNWVHKADLQLESGRSPDHVAVDETVIRLDDEQYWLYAAVDPELNVLLYTTLKPTRNNGIASSFFQGLREKHGVVDVVFLVDSVAYLKIALHQHGLQFRHETHRNGYIVERFF